MNTRKILYVASILIYFLSVKELRGQHLGAASDNYALTQKVLFNPASIADAKPFADLRLFGVSQLAQNTFAFLPNADFTQEITDNVDINKKYNGYSETDILLPAYIQTFKKQAIGFNIRFRNFIIARKIPGHVAKFGLEGLGHRPLHGTSYNEQRFWLKNMAWGEFGLNYGRIFNQRGNRIITIGASLKLLSGFTSAGFLAKDLKYQVDTLNVDIPNIEGRLGLTVPGALTGFGIAADLGVEYKHMLKDNNSFHVPHHRRGNCEVRDYKYKLGASILDLGYINFNKSSYNYKFNGDSINLAGIVQDAPDGFTDLSRSIDQAITNSGASATKKEKLFATTPLTFVLQADYNFENNIYLNAQLLIGMRQSNFYGAERMSMLTVTPRYELKKITVALPMSIYRYGRPGMGIYARLWWVSVGTNNFVPFLLKNDMYGADAYASVNIPIFRSRDCKGYVANKGNYCPKPKLKIFNFGHKKPSKGGMKKDGNTRNKAERKKIKRVKRKKKF